MSTKILLFICLIIPPRCWASDSPWQTDYESALTKAQAEDKLVLILFTGSDWCHWCQKLERELFNESFVGTQVSQIAVPLRLDFPRKGKLTPKQSRHNQILKVRFEVDSFPTAIALDPISGKQLLRHSYTSKNAESYLQLLSELKN